ncbi:MAG TPA: proline iminopeptidase-family hydrolase [Gaiellaceae bacterium]|nr:proline iminopeptidase-family hydrolase [Gaiellaceae bacterium]
MRVEEGRIPFRGHETWYRSLGDKQGVSLVCLHGGPGSTHLGLTALEPLADERRVVLYDQLGSGNSSQPSDPALWTIELFLAELANLRDALGLDRVHVLGHSWGGMLAQEYALTQPNGLAGLVLSSTLSSSTLWREESLRLRADLPPAIREPLDAHEQAGTTDDPEYEAAIFEFLHRHLCRLEPWPPIVEQAIRSTNLEVYNTMWGPSEAHPTGVLAGWDVTPRLGEIRVPVLVLCGRYDEATPRQAETIAQALPDAELVIFEESAHLAPVEETERYVATVRAFLSRVDAASI